MRQALRFAHNFYEEHKGPAGAAPEATAPSAARPVASVGQPAGAATATGTPVVQGDDAGGDSSTTNVAEAAVGSGAGTGAGAGAGAGAGGEEDTVLDPDRPAISFPITGRRNAGRAALEDQLMGIMGCERALAKLALRRCSFNVPAAVELLLGGGEASLLADAARDAAGGRTTDEPDVVSPEEARLAAKTAGANPNLARVQQMSRYDHLHGSGKGARKRDRMTVYVECPECCGDGGAGYVGVGMVCS